MCVFLSKQLHFGQEYASKCVSLKRDDIRTRISLLLNVRIGSWEMESCLLQFLTTVYVRLRALVAYAQGSGRILRTHALQLLLGDSLPSCTGRGKPT